MRDTTALSLSLLSSSTSMHMIFARLSKPATCASATFKQQTSAQSLFTICRTQGLALQRHNVMFAVHSSGAFSNPGYGRAILPITAIQNWHVPLQGQREALQQYPDLSSRTLQTMISWTGQLRFCAGRYLIFKSSTSLLNPYTSSAFCVDGEGVLAWCKIGECEHAPLP